jgi:PleD family two-component response regulator
LVVADDLATFDRTVADAIVQRTFHCIQRMHLADRHTVRVFQMSGRVVDDGDGVRVLATTVDITEQQEVKNELAFLATHDPLTDLHNRRGILALIHERLSQHPDDPGTLLLIDIDHFKDINDLRGHAIGDQVMRALTSQACGTVARCRTGQVWRG